MKIDKLKFNVKGDERGSLISLEGNKNVPFEIKRIYYIYGNTNCVTRGYHAHHNLKQIAIALNGSCRFILDNGRERKDVLLSSREEGLLIEGIIWREMTDFSKDCVLLVLASEHYDENDYIRNYDEFKRITNEV